MSTNQGLRQASIRGVTSTALPLNGDWCALFENQAQTSVDVNGGMIEFLQAQTGLSIDNINGLKAAFAAAAGENDWNSLGTFSVS